MSEAKNGDPKFDIVIFGATSFVGKILCHYLMKQYGADGDISWAIAARSKSKLDQLHSELGTSESTLPTIIADAADETSLKPMVTGTKVVISTVGPYALYGEPLVKVCAENGTDYCDLTGEVQWIRRMIGKYESTAKSSGARIVHCCGFDSIPSDLGVYHLQQQAQEKFGSTCDSVKMRVKGAKGGASGGTVASMMNLMEEVQADPSLRRQLADPYSICPGDAQRNPKQKDLNTARKESEFESWVAPFVMAAINTRIVQRSNALMQPAYSTNFSYDEGMLTGGGVKGFLGSQAVTLGMAGFGLLAFIGPTRRLLQKYVVPKPGEGPSPEAQENGYFDLRFYGRTAKGEEINTKVTGDRDPGYGSTAKMLAQAGICLAKDISSEEKGGGFWTPATVFGDTLIERLKANAGLTFEVI